MKPYLSVNALPTQAEIQSWTSAIQHLAQAIQQYKIVLTNEERATKRKMGSRRLAYAQSAERLGNMNEQVMPRNFNPQDLSTILAYYSNLRIIAARIGQLQELCDDTLMAAGIDAMTYTKVIHDALRSANNVDASFDSALKELDEYNTRAQVEVEEETEEDLEE